MKIFHREDIMFKEWVEFLENSKDLPICINFSRTDEDCIVFNMEQSNRISIDKLKSNNIIEIWDYSLQNIQTMNNAGIFNVRYVPFKIWDAYKDKILSYNIENTFDYDVIFFGWSSERRVSIIEKLKKEGLNVIAIWGGKFSDERDKLIAKSKILLNIHYSEDYNIFELYRCFPWIGVNKTIVSENSLDNHPHCHNVDYNEIIPKIKELLYLNNF